MYLFVINPTIRTNYFIFNLLCWVDFQKFSWIIRKEKYSTRLTFLTILAEPSAFGNVCSRWVKTTHVKRSVTTITHQQFVFLLSPRAIELREREDDDKKRCTFVFFQHWIHNLHSLHDQSYFETMFFSRGGSQHSAWKLF